MAAVLMLVVAGCASEPQTGPAQAPAAQGRESDPANDAWLLVAEVARLEAMEEAAPEAAAAPEEVAAAEAPPPGDAAVAEEVAEVEEAVAPDEIAEAEEVAISKRLALAEERAGVEAAVDQTGRYFRSEEEKSGAEQFMMDCSDGFLRFWHFLVAN